jgi:uncharacterized protein
VTDAGRTKISILVYLILTAAISSLFYYPIIAAKSLGVHSGLLVLGLMWSPGTAGLLTRLIFQRNLRGHGWGWGKTKYQFAGYWIPLAYAAAVYLPLWFAGYADFAAQAIARFAPHLTRAGLPAGFAVPGYFVFVATVGVAGSCVSALGEELGWRGFLVPQLAKVTCFPRVAVISGIIWSLWHYPVLLFANYHGRNPLWYSLVCFTVMVVGISFVFAWLRLKSGSVWTGMLLHASHNLFIQGFFDPLTRQTPFTDYAIGEFGAGLALAGIAIAVIFYRKRNELENADSYSNRAVQPEAAPAGAAG